MPFVYAFLLRFVAFMLPTEFDEEASNDAYPWALLFPQQVKYANNELYKSAELVEDHLVPPDKTSIRSNTCLSFRFLRSTPLTFAFHCVLVPELFTSSFFLFNLAILIGLLILDGLSVITFVTCSL